ncbi:MAG TPA: hypothetical protein VIK04_03575 [Solirubrobacteraceae bacterium]
MPAAALAGAAPTPMPAAVPSGSTPPPVTPGARVYEPPPPASTTDSNGSPFPADRPEIAVGASFAGGLVLALILKRLAR